MEEEIHASVVSIQNMEAACARFGQVVLEHLPEIESQLQQVTENLEEHRTTLRKEISRLSDRGSGGSTSQVALRSSFVSEPLKGR